MRGDVSELSELLIRPLQFFGALQDAFLQMRIQLIQVRVQQANFFFRFRSRLFRFLSFADISNGARNQQTFINFKRAGADFNRNESARRAAPRSIPASGGKRNQIGDGIFIGRPGRTVPNS